MGGVGWMLRPLLLRVYRIPATPTTPIPTDLGLAAAPPGDAAEVPSSVSASVCWGPPSGRVRAPRPNGCPRRPGCPSLPSDDVAVSGRSSISALYRFGSSLFLAGFRALGVDLRVHGADHIPTTGPVVLASNHIGYLDFAFVMLAPPAPRREVRFLARDDFFHNPVLGFLLRRLGQIPVDVHGDPMQAAAAAQDCLENGEIVGIHP
jgi:hypothetical protein